jgi:hypothetical protein
MLRSEDVTTPFPSEVTEPLRPKEPVWLEPSTYPNSQVRLAMLAQKTLWKLYTERKIARSWAQIHSVMTSLMLELEDWASEAMTQYTEASHAVGNYEMEHTILKFQYYKLKILINRPALRRIERCCDTNIEDFVAFDQEAAEACVQAAQDVAALLPGTLNTETLYEKGPWWSVVHNSTSAMLINDKSTFPDSTSQSCNPSPSSSSPYPRANISNPSTPSRSLAQRNSLLGCNICAITTT